MQIKINNQSFECQEEETILAVCKRNGIRIPTLCAHPDLLPSEGVCRMCLVETNQAKGLVSSCTQKICEGLEVRTETEKVNKARKINLELLWADHAGKCAFCEKNGRCELQNLAKEYGPDEFKFVPRRKELKPNDELDLLKDNWSHAVFDDANPCLARDSQYCVECRRCVRVCKNIQTVEAYGLNKRSSKTNVGTPYEMPLDCIFCGQCSVVCPTAAITEKDETHKFEEAVADPKKMVVVQFAPSVRFAFGEEFGQPPGTFWEGKLVASLKELGADKVFDTTFAADLTIVEEATELLLKIKSGKAPRPMFTSCCPSWILFIEKYFPEFIPDISTSKSPQQMLGALLKTYWAEKEKIHPENIFSVSVMPCISKKYEAQREEMKASGTRDVDLVLTVRELARLLRKKKIDPSQLKDQNFDPALGISTGAGILFGQSGGVMEAALRTAVEKISGKELGKLEFEVIRGDAEYRTAEIEIGSMKLKVAIVHEIRNARKLLEDLKAGRADYDFVEVMSCPNGCIGGGGMPQPTSPTARKARIQAIFTRDKNMPLRKSHENPAVKKIYKEFLGAPGSEKAEELLHTGYVNRKK
ncbi:MAG: [FeFe] hydrogenase, group A [Candidatus Moranbacteria bacterium]|nr:[FeFe] hydrogenase, group A [Candidatus Moranbacteria bacterium]